MVMMVHNEPPNKQGRRGIIENGQTSYPENYEPDSPALKLKQVFHPSLNEFNFASKLIASLVLKVFYYQIEPLVHCC